MLWQPNQNLPLQSLPLSLRKATPTGPRVAFQYHPTGCHPSGPETIIPGPSFSLLFAFSSGEAPITGGHAWMPGVQSWNS